MTIRWLSMSLGALAWCVAAQAPAVPVTYTFHAIASGTLAGSPFSHKYLVVRLVADTATTQFDATHLYGRNIASSVSLALDGSEIGTSKQPLAVAANCASVGTAIVGIDFADTVLPNFDYALSGAAGASACPLQSSVSLQTAVPTTIAVAEWPTSAGPLSITAIDSMAYESFVMYAPTLVLRVASNPYGPLSVAGATFDGTTITGSGGDVVVDLGPAPSAASLDLQYETLVIGPSQTVTFRAGAPGQSVVLGPPPPFFVAGVSVQGTLAMAAGNGAEAPALQLSAAALEIAAQGRVVAPSGASFRYPTNGGSINNHGTLDGGKRLTLAMTGITGGGLFVGDTIDIWAFAKVNYATKGKFYLDNGIDIAPSSASEVEIVARTFSLGQPNYFNFKVHGDALLWMPRTWPPAPSPDAFFANNNVGVYPGDTRAAGVADPSFGGGSMLVQATGSLRLKNGGGNDFVFPGGIALTAGATLDLNGLAIVQGWTTTGMPFQGAFFESPNIVSSAGPVSVYTNDLNWVNFSTMPHAPIRSYTLVRNADGSASYHGADGVAPHLNTYSLLIDTSATGGCWTCLVNSQPVDMTGP